MLKVLFWNYILVYVLKISSYFIMIDDIKLWYMYLINVYLLEILGKFRDFIF